MIEQILEFATIGKYILVAVGVIGAIMLLFGIYKGERTSMQRGGYMIVLAVILWLCAHFIFKTSEERAMQRMYEIGNQYGY